MSILQAVVDFLSKFLPDKTGTSTAPAPAPTPAPTPSAPVSSRRQLAWGLKVSEAFRSKVFDISDELGINPDHLMAVMAFESANTFSPSVKNHKSSATGLIQFMAATAKGLGTTTAALAAMSAVAQLDYVRKYFQPYKGRLKTLPDVYMAVLYPRAIGKADSYPIFLSPSAAYSANNGLDADKSGQVTKAEAAAAVEKRLKAGLLPGAVWRG